MVLFYLIIDISVKQDDRQLNSITISKAQYQLVQLFKNNTFLFCYKQREKSAMAAFLRLHTCRHLTHLEPSFPTDNEENCSLI